MKKLLPAVLCSFCFFVTAQNKLVVKPDTYSLDRAAKTKGEFRFKNGENFAKWKQKARADLIKRLGMTEKWKQKRIPLNPKILWTRKVKNGTITKLTIESEKGCIVPMYLCLPEGKGPFPVWICVQGHGTGMHVSINVQKDEKSPRKDRGDRDNAIQCLENGYAALCVEQRAMGARSLRSDQRPNCEILAMHALMFGETLIGNRVFDVDRAIDFIYTRPELRKDLIGITGNSGGGTTSIYAGAILDRLTHVMPSCCFSSYRDSIMAMVHCKCNYFPGMLNWGDMGDLAGLCAPKPLVIINGVNDKIFPIKQAKEEFVRTQKIYQTAGAPDKCKLVIGPAGHRYYKDAGWSAMKPLCK